MSFLLLELLIGIIMNYSSSVSTFLLIKGPSHHPDPVTLNCMIARSRQVFSQLLPKTLMTLVFS